MKKFFLYIVLSLLFGIMIIFISEKNKKEKSPYQGGTPKHQNTSTKTSKQNKIKSIYKITNGNDFAAITEDVYDRLMKLVEAKDKVAVNQLMESGYVIILKKGLEVQIMEHSWGKIRIRLKGTNTEVWTAIEAVK